MNALASLADDLDAFDPEDTLRALAKYKALLPTLTARERRILRPAVIQARRYVADWRKADPAGTDEARRRLVGVSTITVTGDNQHGLRDRGRRRGVVSGGLRH